MTSGDPLAVVRDAIVRGLSFDEPLLVATGLRPTAELDPTEPTREELVEQARRAENKVAGAVLRVNERWHSLSGPRDAHDELRAQNLERARASTVGPAGSLAVRLVRCWADVPRDASFLYVTDRRWLVTMTVAAAREWRAAAPPPERSEGLVRDLGKAARQLGQSLASGGELTRGLEQRAQNGSAALIVVWSVTREDVTVSAGTNGVWLAFSDQSGLWLRPGRPEWPLDQRVAALQAAGVAVGAA